MVVWAEFFFKEIHELLMRFMNDMSWLRAGAIRGQGSQPRNCTGCSSRGASAD